MTSNAEHSFATGCNRGSAGKRMSTGHYPASSDNENHSRIVIDLMHVVTLDHIAFCHPRAEQLVPSPQAPRGRLLRELLVRVQRAINCCAFRHNSTSLLGRLLDRCLATENQLGSPLEVATLPSDPRQYHCIAVIPATCHILLTMTGTPDGQSVFFSSITLLAFIYAMVYSLGLVAKSRTKHSSSSKRPCQFQGHHSVRNNHE
jgi:hypothetical protein